MIYFAKGATKLHWMPCHSGVKALKTIFHIWNFWFQNLNFESNLWFPRYGIALTAFGQILSLGTILWFFEWYMPLCAVCKSSDLGISRRKAQASVIFPPLSLSIHWLSTVGEILWYQYKFFLKSLLSKPLRYSLPNCVLSWKESWKP